jgi:hypothetical protein
MGKFERRDSEKVLAGKPILLIKPRPTVIDFLLEPFRALKNWNRRRQIRKNIFKQP